MTPTNAVLSTDLRPPYRTPPPEEPVVAEYDERDLGPSALLPHRTIDLVLVDRVRFARTVAGGSHPGRLVGILLSASALLAIPYGLVLGRDAVLRVVLLFVGSVLLCLPSLHVFSAYLGCRMSVSQNLVVALLVSSVAGMFALGFAPILWFVDITTADASLDVGEVSVVLLTAAIVAGLVHLNRIVMGDPELRPSGSYRLVMAGWQLLFVYVAYRMGSFLGLS